jgi:hypothetical protein
LDFGCGFSRRCSFGSGWLWRYPFSYDHDGWKGGMLFGRRRAFEYWHRDSSCVHYCTQRSTFARSTHQYRDLLERISTALFKYHSFLDACERNGSRMVVGRGCVNRKSPQAPAQFLRRVAVRQTQSPPRRSRPCSNGTIPVSQPQHCPCRSMEDLIMLQCNWSLGHRPCSTSS